MFGPPVLRLSEGVGALKFYNENPFKGSVSVSALGLTGPWGLGFVGLWWFLGLGVGWDWEVDGCTEFGVDGRGPLRFGKFVFVGAVRTAFRPNPSALKNR